MSTESRERNGIPAYGDSGDKALFHGFNLNPRTRTGWDKKHLSGVPIPRRVSWRKKPLSFKEDLWVVVLVVDGVVVVKGDRTAEPLQNCRGSI